MKEFLWIPENGFRVSSIERLQHYFAQPKKPMMESWQMGVDRYRFDELYDDLNVLPLDDLFRAFEEISVGLTLHGKDRRWTDWYHYLMCSIISRNHESNNNDFLLEYLITGFISQYPNGVVNPPYEEFLDDAFYTIGSCIMDKECWKDDNIVIGKMLWLSNSNYRKTWGWKNASGDFSSSMFFCLKYLPSNYIQAWLKSVFSIKSPHWRAQLIVWFVGAEKIIFDRIKNPSDFDEDNSPNISWAWSHLFEGKQDWKISDESKPNLNFIPEANRETLIQSISELINEQLFKDWMQSITKCDYLINELTEIPNRFYNIYVVPDKSHDPNN